MKNAVTPPKGIALGALFLAAFLTLSGCGTGWWKVDQSGYQPPPQTVDQMRDFDARAPVGGSSGNETTPATATQEDAGDPAFQPRPAK
ncbi:MAG: hypothetical protein ABSC19_02170 [Syntrophorhabdales bacterium]|jgi:hypothetical protein